MDGSSQGLLWAEIYISMLVCDNFGFTISTKKTEVMHQPAQRNMYHEPHIFVNDEPLKATDTFTYMGSTLSRKANIDLEVNNRLSKANSAFGRLRKKVCDRRGISEDTKLHVYMAVVLMYTWLWYTWLWF